MQSLQLSQPKISKFLNQGELCREHILSALGTLVLIAFSSACIYSLLVFCWKNVLYTAFPGAAWLTLISTAPTAVV